MVILALGKRGSGKSALLRKLTWLALQANPAAVPQIFWHDPHATVAAPAAAIFTSAAQWEQTDPTRRPPLAVFRGVEDMEELGALALRVQNCTLVLDEIDRAFTSKRWTAPSLRRITHEGRHYRVALWGGCRRFADLGEDLVGACTHAFLFHHGEAAIYDLQRIERTFGPPAAAFCKAAAPGSFVFLRT